ncbi:MAG: flavodoxin, partial [Clostridiales bacterium]|nr:flavodoxin [Clostridiales bacterium]
MKGIILYQSKYGATKKYAHWLAEDTGFAVMEV